MQAYVDGENIQYKSRCDANWSAVSRQLDCVAWDWWKCEYRRQPKPKPHKLSWIKNTGVAPDCVHVLARLGDYSYCQTHIVDDLDFSIYSINPMKDYIILD